MLIGALEKYSIRLSCRDEQDQQHVMNDSFGRRESVKINLLFGPSTSRPVCK